MPQAIDLRSDTVTRPTPEMLEAMMVAEVGDDVFGEDPTARRLEKKVAGLLGKDRGLFVPSGVMGNQLAIRLLTDPGDEVLCELDAHIAHYESGAPAAISGVLLRTIAGRRGTIPPSEVAAHLRHGHEWEARSRLLCVENTHNRAGGTVVSLRDIQTLCQEARRHDLALHLDGARLWNASIASGIAEREYAAGFDTVVVCLSKGLGAPVGSVLAGPADLMTRARRIRKMLGGGMRQIGFLAAAGLYALEHHRQRLAEDHHHARILAEGIDTVAGLHIDPTEVDTNIVMFRTDDPAAEVVGRLAETGILMVPFGPRTIRATTHLDVSAVDIEVAISQMQRIFGRK
jgi:threonine aldolase